MRQIRTLCGALLALLLLASAANAAHGVANGRIKAVNADKKDIVMTDGEGKDWTFKLADKVIFNRGGKESQSDLAAGDMVSVHYEKGIINNTADYVLVREGESKNWELADGKVKSYEGDKRILTITDEQGKDTAYMARDAKATLNNKDCKFDDLKIGEHVLAIVSKDAGKSTLKLVMCDRK